MTTDVGTNGATTLFRMNFSGYVGHVNIFSELVIHVIKSYAVYHFFLLHSSETLSFSRNNLHSLDSRSNHAVCKLFGVGSRQRQRHVTPV